MIRVRVALVFSASRYQAAEVFMMTLMTVDGAEEEDLVVDGGVGAVRVID